MQVVVLVGGQGTRLRPLTQTTPKPLVPIANRPLIEHVARWLEAAGVDQIILATQYRAAAFDDWLHGWQGVPIVAVEEPVPLGTAGAVANVAHLLHGTTAIVNGDNVTNIDLEAMLAAHQRTRAVATIGVAAVDDPTGRGVAVMDQHLRLHRFQEKPAPGTALARTVNTGTYLIEPAVLDLVAPGQPAMWETDVFPALIARGEHVYGFDAPHIWLDAGTPAGYFATERAILSGQVAAPDGIWVASEKAPDIHPHVVAPAVIGRGATVDPTASIEGPASIGHGCHVGRGARIVRSALWNGCIVADGATVTDSIIGYNTTIAAGASVTGALVGDRATIQAGVRVTHGSRIAPDDTV